MSTENILSLGQWDLDNREEFWKEEVKNLLAGVEEEITRAVSQRMVQKILS